MLGALRRWKRAVGTGRSPQYWRAQRSADGTAASARRPVDDIESEGSPSSSASRRSHVSRPTASARWCSKLTTGSAVTAARLAITAFQRGSSLVSPITDGIIPVSR